MQRATLLTALVALSGCTLVTGGVVPPACSTQSQCAILNEVNGIAPDACELYQCSTNAICELGVRDADRDGLIAPECATAAPQLPVDCNDAVPGGTEICNGLDDDCDGVIDERFVFDGVAANPLPAEAPTPLVEGTFAESGYVGYGTGGSALAMAYAGGGAASFGLASGAMNIGPLDMSFARAEEPWDLTARTLIPGCHVWDGTSAVGGEDLCRFHELSLGLTADVVFTTAISQGGCRHGQVRVGYFPRSSASTPAVIERGPLRRTPVFGGVDVGAVDGGIRCTGASRTSGVWGAARPALAAMDLSGSRDQALSAWIADTFERRACSGVEADVEVLGLHVQEASSGTYGWVTASGEGTPQAVGRTTGGGRPGIGVWDNTGYVVAFGAAGGGVQLVFVEMMEAPPAFTDGGVDDRTGLETAPLTVTDLGVITAGAADDVVVATGSIRAGGIDLGLAWREGCDGESETILFRQLFLAREGSNVSIDEARSHEAIDLTPSPTSEAGPPAIVYMYDGMLAPGVDRADDRPTGTPQTDGGWIVAWSDATGADPSSDTRVLARRVSEADGMLLNDEELLVLSAPGDARRIRPVLYRGEDDRVFHAFLTTGAQSAFRGGPLTCVPEE